MPISDTPGVYNWTWYAGQTLSKVFTVAVNSTPVDLTGYTSRLMARTDLTAGTATVTLGTADITLGGTAGTITVAQTAAQTAAIGSALSNTQTPLVYDLELVNGADVTRLLGGILTISPEVTR